MLSSSILQRRSKSVLTNTDPPEPNNEYFCNSIAKTKHASGVKSKVKYFIKPTKDESINEVRTSNNTDFKISSVSKQRLSRSHKKLLQNKNYRDKMNQLAGKITDKSFISDINDESSPLHQLLNSDLYSSMESIPKRKSSILLKRIQENSRSRATSPTGDPQFVYSNKNSTRRSAYTKKAPVKEYG